MFAEELIKNDQLDEGIDKIKLALEIQTDVYDGVINADVGETMVLLAEALTLTNDDYSIGDAIKIYEQLQAKDESTELYRKMAPLYTKRHEYQAAV